MAIPVNLKDLLSATSVESSRIEFKKDYNPSPILHSICAFANDIDNIGGGYVLVGVEEENGVAKLPITGIEPERVDGVMKKLLGLCHRIEPLYQPVVEPVKLDGQICIVVWCPGGHGRPYKASEDATSKKSWKYYYIRKFSSSIKASREEEKELFRISEDIPYDDRPNFNATVEDLSKLRLVGHLEAIHSSLAEPARNMDTKEIARNMRLLSGPPERELPVNAALLLFGKDPQKLFPHAVIDVVHIPYATGKDMVEKQFAGGLQEQLKGALDYIQTNYLQLKVRKKTDSASSDRVWNWPYEAVQEILANAIYHRDYQLREPVTVRITKDVMEITSFPGFHRSITDTSVQIRDFRARLYRNRRIGDFLKELGLIEGRNTGFPNAVTALENNGSPQFEVIMNPERDFLSIVIPIHPAFEKSPTRQEAKLDSYKTSIVEAVQAEGKISLTDLARKLGYKGISAKLRRAVFQLVDEKRLVKDGNLYKVQ